MPDYVYALHDFAPENPDEVSFKVGDRIEVVEKDELYGDGWWQVSTHSNIDDDEGVRTFGPLGIRFITTHPHDIVSIQSST